MASDALKYSSVITLVLSIYGNVRYLAGRAGHVIDDPEKDPYYRIGFTPFTANLLVLLIYWGWTLLLQIAYVAQYFYPLDESTTTSNPVNAAFGGAITKSRAKVVQDTGFSFNVFNILHFAWLLLFVSGHYILSELVLIINLFNVTTLYITRKTYKDGNLANVLLVHLPVAALPLSWLLYAIFWNGAVVFDKHGLVARIFANIFIWNFLLVPVFFLAIYRDWATGISTAVLVLGLALGQFFTRVFALQWIFAFAIAGFDFLASLAVFTANVREGTTATDAENAPLINN